MADNDVTAQTQADELVHYAVTDGVATITLDSPHNRNALSQRLVAELRARLHDADEDDTVKAVVLRSSGRVFCSGADLSEAATVPMVEGARAIVGLQRTIVALTKPVVTELAGPVRAGGIGIVASSDIVVAAESADFALTEVKLGLTPAVISLTVLPRLTSRAAAYTFLTGEKFTAAEAVGMGLVTRAVPADQVEAEVARVAASLASGSTQGLRETKLLLAADLVHRIDARGEEMAQLSGHLFGTPEAREAMLAFLSRKS